MEYQRTRMVPLLPKVQVGQEGTKELRGEGVVIPLVDELAKGGFFV